MELHQRLALIADAFSPAAPIHRADLLAGRTEQLFSLQDMSRTTGAHAAIYGERGVGKTSLSSVFAQDLEDRGVHVPTITCGAMNDFEHLWDEMFQEWEGKFAEDTDREVLRNARLGMTQQTVVRTVSAVGKEVVFIFDEFDNLADAAVSADFANVMKAFSDRRAPAHVVVVGIAEDIEMLMSGHQSISRGLREVSLPRLSPGESRTILDRGYEIVGMELPDHLAERIVRLSYGLPHFAHAYGKQLALRAARAEVDSVSDSHWPDALEAVISDARQQIFGFYSDAITSTSDPTISDVLLACALVAPDDVGYFGSVDIATALHETLARDLDGAELDSCLDGLCETQASRALEDIELMNGTVRYRFVNPLLRPYILAKALKDARLDADDPRLADLGVDSA